MRPRKIAKLESLIAEPRTPAARRLRAARRLVEAGATMPIVALARATGAHPDAEIEEVTRTALSGRLSQSTIDEICAEWFHRPTPFLGDLIARHRWVAVLRTGVRVRTALHVNRLEAIVDDGERIAEELLLAAVDTDLPTVMRVRARSALASLTNTAAQEAVFAAAVHKGNEAALGAVAAGRYRPADPVRRALLLFLAGKFDEYEALDFDGSLLRAARLAADPDLVSRLAAQARAHGRLEWVRAIAHQSAPDGFTDFTDDEWDAVGGLLADAGRYEELWRMAIDVTPVRAVDLLRQLDAADRLPKDGADRIDGIELAEIARRCVRHPLARTLVDTEVENEQCVLAIAPDGSMLATGATSGLIELWHLPSGEPAGSVRMRPHWLRGTVPAPTAIAISPVGALLIAAAEDAHVQYWSLPDLTPVELPSGGIDQWLAMRPDGRRLVTADGDGDELTLRQLPSGAPRRRLTLDFTEALAMSPDGSLIAASVGEGVRVWQASAGKRVADIPAHAHELAISPAGDHLVTHLRGESYQVWSLPRGELLATVPSSLWYGDPCNMMLTPDGSLLVTRHDGAVARLLRMPFAEPAHVIEFADPELEADTIAFTATPDGRLLVTSDEAGVVRLWHLPSGAPAGVLHTDEPADFLAMSPAGGVLAGSSDFGSVRLWLPRVYTAANTPIGQLALADAEALRALPDPGEAEQPWIELIARLVERRHRHDIEIDGGLGPGATDIALDPEPEET